MFEQVNVLRDVFLLVAIFYSTKTIIFMENYSVYISRRILNIQKSVQDCLHNVVYR